MNGLMNRIKQQPLFFYGYLLVFIAGSFFLLINGKAGSFFLLNGYHCHWLDIFFTGYTYAGDGIVAMLLAAICYFLLKKRKMAVILLLAYAITGIIAQLIKPLLHSPRPAAFFYPQRLPFFIDDIILSGSNSFPSGHTVTAFAMVTVLAVYSTNKRQQILLLLAAILVGFSRIYLSQHFLADVLAGSVIGVLGALLCVYFCRNINENKLVFRKYKQKTIDR